MSENRLRLLLNKLLRNQCTAEEKEELFELVMQAEDDPQLQQLLHEAWNSYDTPTHTVPEQQSAAMLKSILSDGKVVDIKQRPSKITWIAAAASVLLVIFAAVYLLLPSSQKSVGLAQTEIKAPEKNKATITLSTGQTIYLDSIKAGRVTAFGNISILKAANGEILYQSTDGKPLQDVIYNTLNNPRGSKVATLTLNDGSRVWLNAGSSITYPVAFTGNDRNVTLNGEAYFDVSHDPKKPFTVFKNNTGITVLGTQFNVLAYDDEEHMEVTLVKGKVRVQQQAAIAILQPGQQAAITVNASSIHVQTADIEQAIAWKEGLFQFEKNSADQVLRDAGRWYDIDIEFEGEKPSYTFSGGISRTSTLSEFISILQMSRVQCRLEGRKLVVKNQ